jgi:hypothetical protein
MVGYLYVRLGLLNRSDLLYSHSLFRIVILIKRTPPSHARPYIRKAIRSITHKNSNKTVSLAQAVRLSLTACAYNKPQAEPRRVRLR